MSEFHVQVVRLGAIEKHPNADSLSIVQIHGGYPCIFRSGDFAEGDLAVYVPVDAIVPENDERWSFLGGHRRIRAKKLRGIFSMGLLTPADLAWTEGQDVTSELRIEKYDQERALELLGSKLPGVDSEPGTGYAASAPVYDIEGLRRAKGALRDGEDVWISEKLHGCNARFMHDGDRLWVGSKTRWLKPVYEEKGNVVENTSVWWQVAKQCDLADRLANMPGVIFYGEVYGQVQDLKYGVGKDDGARFAIFDVLDPKSRTFLNVDAMFEACERLSLPVVPTLYRGPWSPLLVSMADGPTTLAGGPHVREGIVVKPLVERQDRSIGRVILKLHGEGYLLRKSA